MADDDDIDPKVIAARAAQVAKNIIAAAGDVADQVFAKAGPAKVDPDGGAPQEDNADKPRYTAADAINTASQLIAIAARGAIELARVPLQAQPSNRLLLLGDHIATVAARSVDDVERVAQDAAEQVEANSYGRDQWVESAVKLTSITMMRGAEVMETISAGPGRYRSSLMTSDPYPVPFPPDPMVTTLELKVMRLGRAMVDEDIAKLAQLTPNRGTMDRDKHVTFALRVNAAGIPSGLYVGEVQAFRPGTTDEVGEPVKVSIGL